MLRLVLGLSCVGVSVMMVPASTDTKTSEGFQEVSEYVDNLLEGSAWIGSSAMSRRKYDGSHFGAEQGPTITPPVPTFRASPFLRQDFNGDWEAAVPLSQYMTYLRAGGKPDGPLLPFEAATLANPLTKIPATFPYRTVLPPWRDGADLLDLPDLLSAADSPDNDGFHHRWFHSEGEARHWVNDVTGARRDFEEIPYARGANTATPLPISFPNAGMVAEELDRAANVATGSSRGEVLGEESRRRQAEIVSPRWSEEKKKALQAQHAHLDDVAIDEVIHSRAIAAGLVHPDNSV